MSQPSHSDTFYVEISPMESPIRRTLSPDQSDLLRQIPSVDELLAQPRLASLAKRVDRALLLEVTRATLADLRAKIAGDPLIRDIATLTQAQVLTLDAAALEEHITSAVEQILSRSLQPVVNASGVILHTNLGRAPIMEAAVEEFRRTATQYSNLEYDLEAGARGKRDVHIAHLLERLTGAESAIAVNNCAAAVLLVLAALAKGGEVIVSRGELIEIGDGFRIPEIMAESGATLREVGTTNRTRIADYERAINENTRLLLRVHPSNFQITGFAEKPTLEELAALSQRANLPFVEDLGSGCLVDLSAAGITEPVVRDSIEAGVSVVMFSGDKLLGGPQAGIIAGKKELVTRIRRQPLFRALRVDKLTTAALAATLFAYLRASLDEIPALRMILLTPQELKRRAENLLRELTREIPLGEVELDITDGASLAGGGSTPTQSLPTKIIRIASARHSAAQLEQRLRRSPAGISVIARIEDNRLVLDLRTVFPEQEPQLVRALAAALR
jgi:L-seryl-tRNA(Ser) seleniumtransferase